MNAMTENQKVETTQELAPYEREALAVAPAKLALFIGSLFLGAGMLDFVGLPESAATVSFITGLGTGAAGHFAASLMLGKRKGWPFIKSVGLLSSWTAATTLGSVALLFGDAALHSVNPWVAMVLGAGTSAFCALRSRVSLSPRTSPANESARVERVGPKELSEGDRYMAAVHEAGHALTLALVPESWREGAFVRLGDSQNVFTHVPREESMWALAPYRRWEMLMLLAGPVITDMIYGGAMEGGAGDMREWRHRAMSVMTAERTEGWVLSPETDLEVAHNHGLLKAIEREQTHALVSFFELNRDLHLRLVDHLLNNDGISPDELKPYLVEVVSSLEVEKALGI